jgi:hypothetical protein
VESSDFIRYYLKNAGTSHGEEETSVHLIFCLKEVQVSKPLISSMDLLILTHQHMQPPPPPSIQI